MAPNKWSACSSNLCKSDVASLYDQRRRVRALEEQLLKDLEFHGIIGKSPAMLEVFDFARKVARHYTNVLLVGPTGSGKELAYPNSFTTYATTPRRRRMAAALFGRGAEGTHSKGATDVQR